MFVIPSQRSWIRQIRGFHDQRVPKGFHICGERLHPTLQIVGAACGVGVGSPGGIDLTTRVVGGETRDNDVVVSIAVFYFHGARGGIEKLSCDLPVIPGSNPDTNVNQRPKKKNYAFRYT